MSKENPLTIRTIKKRTIKHEKPKKDIKFFKKPAKDSSYLQPIEETKNEVSYDRALSKYEDYKTKNVEDWLLKVKMVSDNMKNTKSTADETFNNGAGDNTDKKYPILKDKEFIKKIMNVSINNNQKGRIRQLLKDSLQMSTKKLIPDVIHNKIQSIIRNSATLENSDLRKLRILYNMLRNALAQAEIEPEHTVKNDKKKDKITELMPRNTDKLATNEKYMVLNNKSAINSDKLLARGDKKMSKEKKEGNREEETKKGPKRYVVFLGNLPADIDKDKLREHFRDLRDGIQHIRIPKKGTDKRTAIAYIEFKDELFYQLALSRHHSMLGNKRINVLYTTQKNTKVSQAEAKGKSAKIIALQKSGKLLGSVPLNRKRSQRRKRMKEARAKEAREHTIT